MGTILPEDFDLRSLPTDSERAVVSALRDRLNDSWIIIPTVRIHKVWDYEIDVVVMNPGHGIIDIEVKGHRVEIKNGLWCDSRGQLVPQPLDQAIKNSTRLGDLLRSRFPSELKHLYVHFGIALPNTKELIGSLPVSISRNQLLLADDLHEPLDRIQMIFAEGVIGPKLTADHVQAVINLLLPDVPMVWDETAQSKRTRIRLEEISATQIRALERLDMNRRVIVTGGAGSGKTRLATAWANRAITRGERVLFACFNDPLADVLAERFEPDSDEIKTGSFLKLAPRLEGMPPPPEPGDLNDSELKYYWDVTVGGHLHANWAQITERFDTIVIDEAQDFSPAWLAQLESLLDEDGPRRVLMVADAAQDVFNRGFRAPTNEDGWTVCELTTNCRNSLEIARLLRYFLKGAESPNLIPQGSGIHFTEASWETAAATLAMVLRNEFSPSKVVPPIAVIAPTRALRDHLRAELGLGSWSDRHDKIICETPRRLKGTEFESVIIVDPDGIMDDQSLYVSISRAVGYLHFLGSTNLKTKFRLE